MTNEEYSKIIAEIETLPTGGITYKKINGKEYREIVEDLMNSEPFCNYSNLKEKLLKNYNYGTE